MAAMASNCPNIKITCVDISQRQIDGWNSDKLPM
jgi:hypothetical protein